MSTAHAPAVNPPLPLTPRAVTARLQHLATNGPGYVQLGATKALARILGLFDHVKPIAQRLNQTTDPTEAQTEEPKPPGKAPLILITSEDELTGDEDDDYP